LKGESNEAQNTSASNRTDDDIDYRFDIGRTGAKEQRQWTIGTSDL
jgi:hypothetical protein